MFERIAILLYSFEYVLTDRHVPWRRKLTQHILLLRIFEHDLADRLVLLCRIFNGSVLLLLLLLLLTCWLVVVSAMVLCCGGVVFVSVLLYRF